MDFDEVIKKRKMIRGYQQTRQVPTGIINKLLKNAHSSPSAGHTQVQEFIVVIDPITKKKLCQAKPGQRCLSSNICLLKYLDLLIDTEKEAQNSIDGAFASMIILLSAVNEGIGASFVGAFEDDKVTRVLGLPVHVKPIGIIALGYPAEKPERFERIELNSLVHYEKYDRTKQLV